MKRLVHHKTALSLPNPSPVPHKGNHTISAVLSGTGHKLLSMGGLDQSAHPLSKRINRLGIRNIIHHRIFFQIKQRYLNRYLPEHFPGHQGNTGPPGNPPGSTFLSGRRVFTLVTILWLCYPGAFWYFLKKWLKLPDIVYCSLMVSLWQGECRADGHTCRSSFFQAILRGLKAEHQLSGLTAGPSRLTGYTCLPQSSRSRQHRARSRASVLV